MGNTHIVALIVDFQLRKEQEFDFTIVMVKILSRAWFADTLCASGTVHDTFGRYLGINLPPVPDTLIRNTADHTWSRPPL